MAHTKPENLTDLSREFAEIRALPSIIEKSAGIFYFKSVSFLHFHDKDGNRWADVKRSGSWERIDAPFGLTATARKNFLRAVRLAYGEMAKK